LRRVRLARGTDLVTVLGVVTAIDGKKSLFDYRDIRS
jgi:DNA-binding IscR family transcriptional regulator